MGKIPRGLSAGEIVGTFFLSAILVVTDQTRAGRLYPQGRERVADPHGCSSVGRSRCAHPQTDTYWLQLRSGLICASHSSTASTLEKGTRFTDTDPALATWRGVDPAVPSRRFYGMSRTPLLRGCDCGRDAESRLN